MIGNRIVMVSMRVPVSPQALGHGEQLGFVSITLIATVVHGSTSHLNRSGRSRGLVSRKRPLRPQVSGGGGSSGLAERLPIDLARGLPRLRSPAPAADGDKSAAMDLRFQKHETAGRRHKK
jgi:hypothetical protein